MKEFNKKPKELRRKLLETWGENNEFPLDFDIDELNDEEDKKFLNREIKCYFESMCEQYNEQYDRGKGKFKKGDIVTSEKTNNEVVYFVNKVIFAENGEVNFYKLTIVNWYNEYFHGHFAKESELQFFKPLNNKYILESSKGMIMKFLMNDIYCALDKNFNCNFADVINDKNFLITIKSSFVIKDLMENFFREEGEEIDYTFIITEFLKCVEILLSIKIKKICNYYLSENIDIEPIKLRKDRLGKDIVVNFLNLNWEQELMLQQMINYLKKERRLYINDEIDHNLITMLQTWKDNIRNLLFHKHTVYTFEDAKKRINETIKIIEMIQIKLKYIV